MKWKCHGRRYKSMLGHVTHLGQPSSVYRSYFECCFLEFWVEMCKWLWRSRSMSPFSIPAKGIQGCTFGANLVIVAQIHRKLLCRQSKFHRILSQNGRNELEGQCQWAPFSIQAAECILRCMFDASVILAQICVKLSCKQGKVYKQTDILLRMTLGICLSTKCELHENHRWFLQGASHMYINHRWFLWGASHIHVISPLFSPQGHPGKTTQ